MYGKRRIKITAERINESRFFKINERYSLGEDIIFPIFFFSISILTP
jgi:hypothetical protein